MITAYGVIFAVTGEIQWLIQRKYYISIFLPFISEIMLNFLFMTLVVLLSWRQVMML